MTNSRRYFVVGTDTDAGKTRVTAALVRALVDAGVRTVAYKPAISGPPHDHDDLELLRAAMRPPPMRRQIHRFAYGPPLAPGIAEDPNPFLSPPRRDPNTTAPQLAAAQSQLARLESDYRAQLSFIEGAGGLRVPMPGGTWLESWIEGMGASVIIVGRLGLGTLNHTLLTYEALERRGLPVHAFALSQTRAPSLDHDPSIEHNLAVLRAQMPVPCLGVLPHHAVDAPPPHSWLELGRAEDWLDPSTPR